MDDFELAYRIVENTGCNLFLTGRAGTGKTTFLRSLRTRTAKRMVVAAPTGVAAINAGGVTLHSLFQLEFGPFLPGMRQRKPLQFSRQKLKVIRTMDVLVIDEISMVRADLLDAVDDALRRLRDPGKPFGGVQLLLIGDLRQLPPVVREEEWRLLNDRYATPYFFSSLALQQTPYVTIELQKVFRQEDPNFLALLNDVRDGRPCEQSIARLNENYKPDFRPDESQPWIRLTSHNAAADKINAERLKSLPGRVHQFIASIEGNFPQSAYPADEELKLKVGAQVMFIKNDPSPDKLFYNGLIGTVTAIKGDEITVRPLDEELQQITVGPLEWENRRFDVDAGTGELHETVDGIFRQIPLRTAWAITIHKSQGLTFTHAIIDAHACFAHGQAYVALSRCKSLEGMVLSTPLPQSAVISDRVVGKYMEASGATRPDNERLRQMEQMYTVTTLDSVFNLLPLNAVLETFTRTAYDAYIKLYPSLLSQLEEMRLMVRDDLAPVGLRFHQQYATLVGEPERLQERLKAAVGYFLPKFTRLCEFIGKFPVEHDNAEKRQRLTRNGGALWDMLGILLAQMRCLQDEEFSAAALLRAKAKAMLSGEQETGTQNRRARTAKATAAQEKSAESTPQEIGDREVYNRLVKWRRETAAAEGKKPFQVLTNQALIALSNLKPNTLPQLLKCKGIGRVKMHQYGPDILAQINSEETTPPIDIPTTFSLL